MYDLNDTIAAVSSPPAGARAILRIAGPGTLRLCERILTRPIPAKGPGVYSGAVALDDELRLDAQLYLFPAPHSYTGEDVAEIHLCTNPAVTEAFMQKILAAGASPAGPGEFTARAYLNGKIDLAQAEAVNEIIVGSNTLQISAAERLLTGRLSQIAADLRADIMDCLSLIEAGLDFSTEDIEFIARDDALERLDAIKTQLEVLLAGSISCESVIDMPAVGVAGAPNAGKSTLVNRLLGAERSIVSHRPKTTRDVLTGLLTLRHTNCVLFDCAGLVPDPEGILDELAQRAASEAIRNSASLVFCVDLSKSNWTEDIAVRELIQAKTLIPAATKCDLLDADALSVRLARLNDLFGTDFLPVSAKDGSCLDRLRETIDTQLLDIATGSLAGDTRYEIRNTRYLSRGDEVGLTARHRQAVTEAIQSITEAIDELRAGNDEITAMLMRSACRAVSAIERQHIDEEILDRIFSRFCVGK